MRAAASPCGFVSRASSVLGRGAFVRRREISRRALSDARTPMSFGASSRRGRDAFFACGSALSPELRDMLSVPTLAASSTDPDEGWGFTDDGLLDWRRSPPASFASRDPARAAEALKGLARASLRRLRAPPPTRADTAAHARLLRNLRARLPEDPYLVLALSLAVVERRCADLHGSNPRGASPSSPRCSRPIASATRSSPAVPAPKPPSRRAPRLGPRRHLRPSCYARSRVSEPPKRRLARIHRPSRRLPRTRRARVDACQIHPGRFESEPGRGRGLGPILQRLVSM